MSILLIKIAQFILSFSIIVTLHELGHFLGARLTGTRVDKFYLFFNPYFSLYKKKIKGTEFGIGWLPLGGYAKIAGMMDESMDKEQLSKKPESWEYRSKKPWQKLIMVTGGVIFNFLLSWIIYTLMFVSWGDSYISSTKIPYGIAVDSNAMKMGLRDGDVIVGLDGQAVEKFSAIPLKIITEDVRSIHVKRNGSDVHIDVPEDFAASMLNDKNVNFISVRQSRQPIDSVMPNSMAEKIGLTRGDEIVALLGNNILFTHELRRSMDNHKGKVISLSVKRGDSIFQTASFLNEGGLLGITFRSPEMNEQQGLVTKSYNVVSALPEAFVKNTTILSSYWSQLKLLTSGKVNVNENLGGLISIGNLFPSMWSWERFWALTAFLSLVIGLINIMPIPALDGGHALIVIIEWIRGKELPRRTQEIIQTVGFVLLIGLMIYSQGLDILRLFKN